MKYLIDRLEEATDTHQTFWNFPAENKKFSLWHLMTISKFYAENLVALGVNKQDRVGLVMNNSSDYVALLLAIWRINATAVPIRPRGSQYTQTDQHLKYCDQICHFSLIIYDDMTGQEAFNDWMTDSTRSAISLDKFQQLESPQISIPHCPIDANDIAILQFSSGSTGRPKGVIVNHPMMMAQLENITNNHTLSRRGLAPESMASWTPIHHDLGLFIGVLAPMYCNCSNVLAPPSYYMRNPARWFALLSEHQVDLTFSTNSALATTFNMISRLHKRDDIDLSRLHIYLAAEKVSPITVRKCWKIFEPLGLPKEQIHIGYGMAENTLGCACTNTQFISITSFLLTEHKELIPVTPDTLGSIELVAVGHPDKDHDISVRDELGIALPELKLGEIYIKSPCISPGYFNNPALSTLTFPDGHFRSGDLGFFYKGELYFYARQDDMIILGGRNIIPQDIEECVEMLDFIRPTTSCLIAKENHASGTQELVLLIEANVNADPDALKQQRLSVQKQAMKDLNVLLQHVIFCKKGAVEKTSSGKKRRKVIRERLLNKQLKILGVDYA